MAEPEAAASAPLVSTRGKAVLWRSGKLLVETDPPAGPVFFPVAVFLP